MQNNHNDETGEICEEGRKGAENCRNLQGEGQFEQLTIDFYLQNKPQPSTSDAFIAAAKPVTLPQFSSKRKRAMQERNADATAANNRAEGRLEKRILQQASFSRSGSAEGNKKPFRLKDFDTPRDREMAVFTAAKKLSEYIFVITEKSPTKYRWNIVSRLLNTSTDVIEQLYRANYEVGAERLMWQKRALTSLSMLDFYADTAYLKRAISFKQMSLIAFQINEGKIMLKGWIRSTAKQEKRNG